MLDDSPPERPGVVLAARKAKLRASLFGESSATPRFGRYVVLGTLGRGGMGTVLEAFDRALDRRVAVKLLHRDLAQQHTRRLVREAQALAKLSHPNVVQVYEVGEIEGQTFVAMELVAGKTLQEWARQSPRPGWKACVEVYMQAGAGLAAAHAKGLVHRDFKPNNAIVDDKGRVRVLDFGLACQVDGVGPSPSETAPRVACDLEDAALDTQLTTTGSVLGTPAYMPLEQMRGHEVDARGDQFSLCVALFEALYGERPFAGSSIAALRLAITEGATAPAPRGSPIPAKLRQVVVRGLQADPAQRWPSMEDLLAELRQQVAPRRRPWLALALVTSLSVVGLGIGSLALEVSTRCAGSAARLAGIWDGARKQEVEDAILGTGLSYAPDTWARVERRLDAHAQAWIEKHEDVCKATRVREEQTEAVMSLRMECLGNQRIALRAAVGVLAVSDARRVSHAIEVVDGLPSLLRCDDVEALGQADLPGPQDPRLAAAVDEQLERLAEAEALSLAGDDAASEAVAEAVVEQAEALGYEPLLADALRWRGRARRGTGAHVEAARDLEQAYLLALEYRYDELALWTATSMISVVGDKQAQYDEGLRWGRVALALSKRSDFHELLRSSVLVNVGVVLRKQGESRLALEHYEQALDIKQAHLGPRHRDVALLLHNIGVVLNGLGRRQEAIEKLERALDIRREALGPGHPDVALTLDTLGVALAMNGDLPTAVDHFRKALVLREAALGPNHPDVATSLNNIGVALMDQGQPSEALVYFQRALPIKEDTLGPEHPDVAVLLVGLAELALGQGQHEAAREQAERAVAIHESAASAPAVLAEARFVLARASWLDPSRRSLALTLATQARDGYAEHPEGNDASLAKIDTWLAEHTER